MAYKYVAYTSDNRLVQGTVNATAEAAAEESLSTAGYRLISLKEIKGTPGLEELFPSLFTVKTQDVILFSRQLATMLETGVGIVPALRLLEGQTRSRAFKRVVSQIADDVSAGSSFSDAVERHSQAFPEVYRRIVRVGERIGELDTILRQAAGYLERQREISKKATKALAYPALIIVVAMVVITILVTVALPPMIDMLTTMEVDLPLPTRILTGLLGFTGAHRLKLLVALVAVSSAAIFYSKRPGGQRNLQRLLLAVPLIGPTLIAGEMARFSRTASLLSQAGMTLPETIRMAGQTSKNWLVREALMDVEDALMQGEGISRPMARHWVFPSMLVQMIRVGEDTGTMDSALTNIANYYDNEVQEKSSALIGTIEPVMTLGIALVVGFIALSVIMPMYQMIGSMG